MKFPTVLFARKDSVYKKLKCDVWDRRKNATKWPGGQVCIAHPPCRGWGRLRHLSKAQNRERALGPLAVEFVQSNGGVLEHPAQSSLWKHCALPRPGESPDKFGGWTLAAPQFWWGHRAQKNTWFYIVGARPEEIPELPLAMGQAPRVITGITGLLSGMPGYRKEVTKAERDATPIRLAEWLIELAKVIRENNKS